jgi:outer membrane protein OmpA-like peptidoglycan-associated protein
LPQLFAKLDQFGTRLQIMAKPLSKASRADESVSGVDLPLKTPAGVWVIIGMAFLIAAAGLGTGVFIAFKSIADKDNRTNAIAEAGDAVAPAGTTTGALRGTPVIENAGSRPAPVADSVEQDAIRQEVLNRIDLMKSLSQGDKDKLYAQVERARGFQKIAVIPFAKNETTPSPAEVEALMKRLKEAEMQRLAGDPTVLFMMVGFADQQGEESKNLEVSRARAESVVRVLKERTDLANVMHSVGMGGQNLFDQTNLEKNRLVEVWAVQP